MAISTRHETIIKVQPKPGFWDTTDTEEDDLPESVEKMAVAQYHLYMNRFVRCLPTPKLGDEWHSSIPDCPSELLGKLTSWVRELPWPAGWVVVHCQRFTRRENGRDKKMIMAELCRMTHSNIPKILALTGKQNLEVLTNYLEFAVNDIDNLGLEAAAANIGRAIFLLEAYATKYPACVEEVVRIITEQRARGAHILEGFPNGNATRMAGRDDAERDAGASDGRAKPVRPTGKPGGRAGKRCRQGKRKA